MKRALIALAFLAACADAEPYNPAADTAAIIAQEQALSAALENEDMAALQALYAGDAVRHQYQTPEENTQAILARRRAVFADVNGAARFTPTDRIVAQDFAYSEGEFSAAYTNPETQAAATTSGRMFLIWAKGADGVWRISRETVVPGPLS